MGDLEQRALLRHFLAALAYRTQKALRGAPVDFGDFHAGNQVRTPKELVRHMTRVLGFARATLGGESYEAEPLETLNDEVGRFHDVLSGLSRLLEEGEPHPDVGAERLLQGPFSDAMTHAGQLALLRRLHGSPVPPEDFSRADVDANNVGITQPEPRAPKRDWPEEL